MDQCLRASYCSSTSSIHVDSRYANQLVHTRPFNLCSHQNCLSTRFRFSLCLLQPHNRQPPSVLVFSYHLLLWSSTSSHPPYPNLPTLSAHTQESPSSSRISTHSGSLRPCPREFFIFFALHQFLLSPPIPMGAFIFSASTHSCSHRPYP